MRTRHEGGHLLMPYLNEVEFIAGTIERRYDSGNAVARKSEDSTDSPFRKALQKKIAHCFAHLITL
jgi:hypothetical protein